MAIGSQMKMKMTNKIRRQWTENSFLPKYMSFSIEVPHRPDFTWQDLARPINKLVIKDQDDRLVEKDLNLLDIFEDSQELKDLGLKAFEIEIVYYPNSNDKNNTLHKAIHEQMMDIIHNQLKLNLRGERK
jgi:hypothetical protein